MIKIFKIFILLAFLLPGLVYADQNEANFSLIYELDSTDPIYCRITGQGNNPFGGPISGTSRIQTSGSSATTTEVTTDSLPFASLGVGDIIFVDPGTGPATVLTRVITAKASGASITVNSAWDLSATGGYNFRWVKNNCGTASTDGWIDVSSGKKWAITVQVDQYNTTGGVNFMIQCVQGYLGAQPVQVWPTCTTGSCNTVQNYSGTAGITSRTTVFTEVPYAACRVAMDIATADDGGDTTTNAEQITIGLTKIN